MSFVSLCASSCVCVPEMRVDTGASYSKRLKFPGDLSILPTEGKKVWQVVRLTVPGAFRGEKADPFPAVFRVCRNTVKKTTSGKKNRLSSVTVPRVAENDRNERRSFKTSGLDCIPSVKSCTLEEINALNRRYETGIAKAGNAHPTDDRTVTLNVPTDSGGRSRAHIPHVGVKKRCTSSRTQNGVGRFLG